MEYCHSLDRLAYVMSSIIGTPPSSAEGHAAKAIIASLVLVLLDQSLSFPHARPARLDSSEILGLQ